MKLGMEVGLGPSHIVLDGDPAPPPQKSTVPQFSAHVCCGQTHLLIKTALRRAVGLGPGDIVQDGNPAPQKGYPAAPDFSAHVYCSQTAGWIKMPLGTKVGLDSGHIALHGDSALPPTLKRDTAPNFRSMFVVAKRLHGSRRHLL